MISAKRFIRMRSNSEELSSPAILGISFAFAICGLLVYAMLAPVPPAVYVALGHSVMEQSVAR